MTITTKDKLAEIAIDLFSRNGFRETSIGDIEQSAGLKRRAGGFYRHFPSKDAVLFEGVDRMAAEMLADIQLTEVLTHKTVRAELLFIANRLLSHAERYRTLRLLLQRKAHKLPKLRKLMEKANTKLVKQDVIPWTEYALERAKRNGDPTSFAFIIFSPILLYLISQDRNQPAFGLSERTALDAWADYWTNELDH